jgi:hypothetical protein
MCGCQSSTRSYVLQGCPESHGCAQHQCDRSLVHAWPCSAPLQPALRPFPATPLLVIFCAHLTFHHTLSWPISHFPPRFPYAFPTALCPFWHICCLDTGFKCLPLLRLPFWRYRWNGLHLYFPKSPKTLQFEVSKLFLHATCATFEQSLKALVVLSDNRINSAPTL